MASKRKRGDAWEYTVKRAGLLDKPVYLTFSNEVDGDAYCARLESLLDKGIIPGELRNDERIVTIAHLARQYEREAHPSLKDRDSLRVICRAKGLTPLPQIDAAWVDGWISELKRFDHAKPGTIISKVGALARCTDWGVRKHLLELPDNPFRTLPNGYAQYTADDAAHAGGAQVDGERDRRLEDGELDRILAVIDGGILARTQRPYSLPHPAALRCIVLLAPEAGMRLREMYTLTLGQVSISRRTVSLEKTKNGDKRQVPLSSAAVAALNAYLPARAIPAEHQADLLFPWWSGNTDDVVLRRTSNFLSKLFSSIFEAAECPGLLIHDLRHEAVSRLFERTSLSVEAVMKITGHRSHKMMMRYLHLRASSLADAMW